MFTVSSRRYASVLACAVTVFEFGCARQAGESLQQVRGRITLDGKPLLRGSVTLRGEPGATVGHQPTGMIETPGEYVVYTNGRPGAPVGSYRVIVFANEATTDSTGSARPGLPKSLIPLRYNSPEESPLRLNVAARPSPTAYDLILSSQSP